jgi:hypothetical protein
MLTAVAHIQSTDVTANNNDEVLLIFESSLSIFFCGASILKRQACTQKHQDERRFKMPASQSGGSSRNRVLVPQARAGLNNMKMEAAQSLGVQIPADGYYGNVTSRETGSLGGYITKNLVAMAEQQLSGGQAFGGNR